MESLAVTLALYRSVFLRAVGLLLRNWPVCGTVFAYLVIQGLAANILSALGIVGGILATLVRAACVASFLYLVEQVVRGSRVGFSEFLKSFGVYLWDVVGVFFLLWLFSRLLVPVLLSTSQGVPLVLAVELLVVVLLNAVPELIYLGHHPTFALLGESYAFVSENWIEWFPPSIVLGFVLVVILVIPGAGLIGFMKTAAVSLVLYFLMVVRGLLFLELSGSTHRSRVFRHRSGG